jgi:hypothetical protein
MPDMKTPAVQPIDPQRVSSISSKCRRRISKLGEPGATAQFLSPGPHGVELVNDLATKQQMFAFTEERFRGYGLQIEVVLRDHALDPQHDDYVELTLAPADPKTRSA